MCRPRTNNRGTGAGKPGNNATSDDDAQPKKNTDCPTRGADQPPGCSM